jgi:hypothetical protein
MLLAIDSGDATGTLDPHDAFFEKTLAAPREHDGLADGVENLRVLSQLSHLMLFPLD